MGWNGKASGGAGKRLVLVVEDSEFNREMLQVLLADDFDIVEAADGLEGLAQLEELHRDLALVLLDIYMPECDGFEFLRRMRSDERFDTIPVIVMTAGSSANEEIKCLELGANDFVVKPYRPDIMTNRMNNMVRLRESASIVNELTWDNVTGLYNKAFFFQAVEEAFANEPGAEFSMVCSEVDNLELLSDRYGEPNTDRILRELADAELGLVPDLVAAGRISTRRFAFLIGAQPSGTDWDGILHTAADGLTFANVSVKFGVVERVDRTIPVPRICNRAIGALESVGEHHGVEVALFDDELHEHQMLEQALRESMEEALAEQQFTVHFQPKHDVRANRTGGAEALVRWIHPEIGFVSPGVFIPLFERNGFISKLDLFVWEEACKEVKRCQELGLPAVPISVNASRLDFDLPDLPERLAQVANKHGIDHEWLHVELTETAYADNPDAVVETLRHLKELGFHTELDDFGAGYSSIVSLNTLPLDVMKLDMSMIRKATELDDFRIVESMIKLAQVLGLKTVVEGVEAEAEALKCAEMGCDYIQGYYYSKPLNRDEFEEYLRRKG